MKYPMTIEQTVEITEKDRLYLELPPGIPVGTTATVNIFIPPAGPAAPGKVKSGKSVEEISGRLWDLCKDSSLTSDRLLQMKRKDKELEEAKYRKRFLQEGKD